jgi:hypothetical protein
MYNTVMYVPATGIQCLDIAEGRKFFIGVKVLDLVFYVDSVHRQDQTDRGQKAIARQEGHDEEDEGSNVINNNGNRNRQLIEEEDVKRRRKMMRR